MRQQVLKATKRKHTMASSTTMLDPANAQAVRRWKLGHHVFHLYLVVMNSLLVEALDAARTCTWQRLAGHLTSLAALYDAATASMKYAADFDPTVYDALVRPSMSPPFLSPGFSGVLNREHGLMLERIRTLRSLLKPVTRRGDAPSWLCRDADRLWAAQSRNRRHHMFVCERFVPGGTSLLKEYFDQRQATESSACPAGVTE
jgi:hypothetical protein